MLAGPDNRGPQGIVFYKADICLDAKGNISKVSTGAKIPLMFNTIQPSDIEIGGFLGGGTSARVNEGIYLPSNYPVAVKTVNILDKEKRAQLLNDLKMLVCDPTKTLQVCPQLVQLYGAYYEEGNIKLILELMDVGSFRDVLNMRRDILGSPKIEERVISLVMQQVLGGLQHLHSVKHQIHRDLKPENILLNSLGQVKLTDFGISKQLESTLEFAKSFIGTMTYMYDSV